MDRAKLELHPLALGPASRERIYSSMTEMFLYEAAHSLGIPALAPKA